MYEILVSGDFIKKDADGVLLNSFSLEKIPTQYRTPIPDIIQAYKELYGDDLKSIYIRGSVARAKAIEGFSDFDCFGVVEGRSIESHKSNIFPYCKNLNAKYTFISNFDLACLAQSDLISSPFFDHWRFALKILSVCIYGDNAMEQITPFKPNRQIAYLLIRMDQRMQKAKENIYANFTSLTTRYWCSWIMRTIVRAGFELVIEREQEYTNELALCLNCFNKYYPEKAIQMGMAINLAINPSNNIDMVIQLMDALGYWLIEQRNIEFGGEYI